MIQKTKISLQEFVRTGSFGPVKLGTSWDAVRTAFGEPPDLVSLTRRRGLPVLWRYGAFEFHFEAQTNLVGMIVADDFRRPFGSTRMEVDPWCLRGGARLDLVKKTMTEAGLTMSEMAGKESSDAVRYMVGAGIQLRFSKAPLERLVAISLRHCQMRLI